MKKRMRQFLNQLMLLTLVINSVLGPVVQAVDSSMSSSGEPASTKTTSSSSSQSDAPTSETVEPQEGGGAELPSSSSTASGEEGTVPSHSEDEVLETTPETPLTEAEETTAEALAKQSIPQAFFASMLRSAPLPVEADGNKIEKITLEWLTADTTNDGKKDNLFQKWDDDTTKKVRLRVSYALSGDEDYEAGAIQIRVPKTIFKTRTGKHIGTFSWAVPEAPDSSGIFQYYLDEGDKTDSLDDFYVLTNTRKLSAASQGYIEGTVDGLVPSQIKDYATGYKAQASAEIQVTTHAGSAIGLDSNGLTAEVDTAARLGKVEKSGASWSIDYPSSFPADFKPANPENYFYVSWTVRGETIPTINQPSTVTFSDTIANSGIILGYRLNSQDVKGNNTNTISGQLFSGIPASRGEGNLPRLIVYSAFPKRNFPNIETLNYNYTVNNTITYRLVAEDDKGVSSLSSTGSQRMFLETKPDPEIGRFFLNKQERYTGVERSALNRILKSTTDIDLKYSISGSGNTYGASLDARGNFNPYTIVVTDKKVWLDTDSPLSGADYEFTYLDFSMPGTQTVRRVSAPTSGIYEVNRKLYSGTAPAGSMLYVTNTDASRAPSYTITGRTSSGSYVRLGTVDFSSGSPRVNPFNGAAVSGSKLTFPVGIVDYQVTMDAKTEGVSYSFEVGLRLKNNTKLKNKATRAVQASTDPIVNVYNEAETRYTFPSSSYSWSSGNSSGWSTTSGSAWGKDSAAVTLRGIYKGADLDKTLSYENDTHHRNARLTYRSVANIRTGVQSTNELGAAIANGDYEEEKEATWYDLLPIGVVPDLSTIGGRPGDSVLSTRTVPNYKNTGRTLLIVKMRLVPKYIFEWEKSKENPNYPIGYYDYPELHFEANYSWQNMKAYGTKLTNVVAYESANAELGDVAGFRGEPDNPLAGRNKESRTAVGNLATAMTNLNPDRDTNSFIYASTTNDLDIDTYAVTSLYKTVETNNTGLYSDGRDNSRPQNVYENGLYKYQVGVSNPLGTQTKEIVFYDILESYTPLDTDADTGDEQWKGVFQGVDVSEFARYGVSPTIYYSTKQNLRISEEERAHANLADRSIWTTILPTDRRQITAVAIDARRKTDGSAFTLPEDSSVSAYILMRAPNLDAIRGLNPRSSYYDTTLGVGMSEAGFAGGAHAYNNIKMSATTSATNGSNAQSLIIEHNYTKVGLLPYTVYVEKEWDDDNDRDRLRPSSIRLRLYGNDRDTGRSVVLNDSNGWKHLFEGLAPQDDAGDYINYTLREDAVPGYELRLLSNTLNPTGRSIRVSNYHEPEKVTITGRKLWRDEDETAVRPRTIGVQLFENGLPTKVGEARPNDRGEWTYTFANLYKHKDGKPITYTVEEKDYVPGYFSHMEGRDIVNVYDPYGDLQISKQVQGLTEGNKDNFFDFVVTLTGQDGQPDTRRYRYETSDGRTGTLVSGDKIRLKHDQTATIKKLRSETQYSIQELDKPGYTSKGTGTTGVIRARSTSKASFTNTYQATGELHLEVTKILEGRALQAYQFVFDLLDESGQLLGRGSNLVDGKVAFKPLIYTAADADKTYTYRIRERDAGLSHYTYDQHEETVTVRIEDNGDGTLKVSPTYDRDGAVFTNQYQVEQGLTLTAWKVMAHGQTLEQGAYTFELYKEGESSPVATATNDVGGRIDFTGLVFTQEDIGQTYTYIAKEKAGLDSRIRYDTSTIRYQVAVADGGDGKLAIETRVEDQYTQDIQNDAHLPIFVNTYKPGSLKIQKTIVDGDPDKRFTFKVKLKAPDGAELPSGPTKGSITPLPSPRRLPLRASRKTSLLAGLKDLVKQVDQLFSPTVAAAAINPTGTITQQGTLGTVTWELYSDRTLVIRPTRGTSGTLPNNVTSWPWARNAYFIQKVLVRPGVRAGNTTKSMFERFMSATEMDLTGLNTSSVTDMSYMFSGASSLTTLAIDNWNVGNVTNMSHMFNGASGLTALPVENWNVGKVTNMSYMFSGTYGLTALPVENWNVGNVTDMSAMFSRVRLTTLPVERWNVGKVTNMSHMFSGASSLTTLPVQNWNVGNVTNMSAMFSGVGLTTLPVERWNVGKVTNMSHMFNEARSLTTLPLENWDVGNVTDMSSMFSGVSLTTLPVERWNVGNVTNMSQMFLGARSLTTLPVERWNVGNVTNMFRMFDGARSLTTLPIQNWDVGNVTNMSHMFYEASGLTTLPVENWDVGNVTNMSRMFESASGLTALPVENWDVGNVTDMSYMFDRARSLTTLPVERWNVGKVTNMSFMFFGASGLTALPVENWDVGNVTNMSRMFERASSLTTLPVERWNVGKVTNMSHMFEGASNLTTLAVDNWDVGNVTDMSYMFDGARSLTILRVENWDVGNVTNMFRMFDGARGLTALPVERWNVGNVTNMSHMFYGARGLTALRVENWNVGKVTDMSYMFGGASGLTTLRVENWDVGNVTNMSQMFNGASGLTALPVERWNVGNVTNMSQMFNGASGLTTLRVESWDVGNVTNMSRMFDGASGLTALPVERWNVGKVTDMSSMFFRARGLTTLPVENWNVGNVTNMSHMFNGASGLTALPVENWNVGKVTNMSYMFSGTYGLTALPVDKWQVSNQTYVLGMFKDAKNLQELDLSNWEIGHYHSEMLQNTTSLSKLILGEKTRFNDSNLGGPPQDALYTGKWIREDKTYGPFTAAELMQGFTPDMAGAWIWEKKPQDYTLAFDGNTGSGSMPVQTLTRGQAYTLPAPSFRKLGYAFKEWNTRADAGGTSYQPGASVTDLTEPGKTFTLYAIWEEVDASVTIRDGAFEVELRGGEVFTLPNLPAGTTYDVYEETEKGWVLVSSNGTTGTIQPNKASTASFVNDYQRGKTSVQLAGQKLLDGEAASGYRFTLKKDGQLLETVDSQEGGGFRFATIVYDRAGTYTYEIAEVVGSDASIDYDTHKETVTVQVTDDGEGNLSAAVSKANTDIVFNNRKKKGSLQVRKDVEGTQDQEKTFTIQVKINNSPTDIREFRLKANETATIPDLPYGTTYEVTEDNLPAGYSLKEIENGTGHIRQATTQARVINTYAATGTANVTATKRLDNAEDPSRELKANEFTFELVDPGTDLTDPADDSIVATATNDEYGAIAFGAVTFTKPGTYTYKLREAKGLDSRVVYDSHVEDVTITAQDAGDGRLRVTVSYDADGAVFTNRITPPPSTPDPDLGNIDLSKEVINLTDANKDKDFELLIQIKDKEGDVLLNRFAYTSDKRASGTIATDELLPIRHGETIRIVNLPEGATVTAIEQVPSGYTLDGASVTEAVVDLSQVRSIRLINHYAPTGSWKPTGTKSLESGNLSEYRFNFQILDDKGREVQRISHDDAGQLLFNDIFYSHEDIGKTYTYHIREERGGERGIIYDATIYTYKVKITDDGEGKILAQVEELTSNKGTGRPDQADFVNKTARYPETGGRGDLIWYGLGAGLILITYFFYRKRENEESSHSSAA